MPSVITELIGGRSTTDGNGNGVGRQVSIQIVQPGSPVVKKNDKIKKVQDIENIEGDYNNNINSTNRIDIDPSNGNVVNGGGQKGMGINDLKDELVAQEIEMENMIMEMATPKEAYSVKPDDALVKDIQDAITLEGS